MGILRYSAYATNECENFFHNMCKVRDKSLRDCVLPRCCAICPENDDCKGLCTPLKKIDKKNNGA